MPDERSHPVYMTDDDLLKIKTKQEVRRWLIHLVVFLVVQFALIPHGYSIFNPLAHVFGGPDRRYDLAYRLTEGWTFILMLDAVVVLSWPLWPKVRDFIMDR